MQRPTRLVVVVEHNMRPDPAIRETLEDNFRDMVRPKIKTNLTKRTNSITPINLKSISRSRHEWAYQVSLRKDGGCHEKIQSNRQWNQQNTYKANS
jgi:hypothetical protein